jgi:hypothetical protein
MTAFSSHFFKCRNNLVLFSSGAILKSYRPLTKILPEISRLIKDHSQSCADNHLVNCHRLL